MKDWFYVLKITNMETVWNFEVVLHKVNVYGMCAIGNYVQKAFEAYVDVQCTFNTFSFGFPVFSICFAWITDLKILDINMKLLLWLPDLPLQYYSSQIMFGHVVV
jgi:hypothetical protein